MTYDIRALFKIVLFSALLFTTAVASPLNLGPGPSPALVELLDTFGISHGSWEEIVGETQKKWLRKSGEERWNITPLKDPCPEKTYALFSRLKMTQTVESSQTNYDTAVVLGATKQKMRKELAFLKEEWKRGVRFKEIVFLVGDRPLDPELEGTVGKNETGLARLLYQEMALPDWKELPATFVDTPKKPGQTRPTTVDTFYAWLAMDPKPGKVVILSGQPFIGRQGVIAERVLPKSFQVETVGEGFTFEEYREPTQGLAIVLDELARWIYEERKPKTCTLNS
jgi:hypothetical protein